ncbi:MAG: transposase [Xanthomonadaceae bacterium]|nr:transposase [Xanthomonadaceae bacterium]
MWRRWLYEARLRYGLCVLNYIVTSNHIHLLVRDQGKGEISSAMQLIAGQIAQRFNRRKGRRGAFWEDRYHATAVETGNTWRAAGCISTSIWCGEAFVRRVQQELGVRGVARDLEVSEEQACIREVPIAYEVLFGG